jgi:hypothetical protein
MRLCEGRELQNPPVWHSLSILQGNKHLSNQDITELMMSAKPGFDFPILSSIPTGNFKCEAMKQPGYYADVEASCQGNRTIFFSSFLKKDFI